MEKKRHDGKYEQNAGYDKWRTSEVKAEGCKMAMWNTYVVEVLAVIQYSAVSYTHLTLPTILRV